MRTVCLCVMLCISTLAHSKTQKSMAFSELDKSAHQSIQVRTFGQKQDGVPHYLQLQSRQSQTALNLAPFDIQTWHPQAEGRVFVEAFSAQQGAHLQATLKGSSVFGQIHSRDGLTILTTDAGGVWAVTLPLTGVTFNQCDTDHESNEIPFSIEPRSVKQSRVLEHVIDLMVIYNPAFEARYPGELTQTRIEHLINIANLTMANSEASIGIRLVATELVNYSNGNTNFEARNDMANALAGVSIAPGLENLAARRDQAGADLVIMIRPHDIENRGSCGIAFFPAQDNDGNVVSQPSLGVNLVSDGMSSWSACLDDVLVHEIGHNLGAGHQLGAGGGALDPRGSALINLNQYTTVMGSFGTGRADRFRGLQLFSNPAIQCGGQACGSNSLDNPADNTSVIREVASIVTNYRDAVSSVVSPEDLPRSMTDADGDGVIDWDDHFPYDASEQLDADLDGVGDNADAFDNSSIESIDTDGDGLGNVTDTDDDADGVPDQDDDFPLDPNESNDADGDGVGDNADRFANDFRESADNDSDGEGNNADVDDDNDGVNELDFATQDLLVISERNNRLLRFDATTGQVRGVEIPPNDGLMTFQSDLAFQRTDQQLIYLSDSSVKRHDLITREPLGTFVRPFASTLPNARIEPAINSGFPTGVATVDPDPFDAVPSFNDTTTVLISTMTSNVLREAAGVKRVQTVRFRDQGADDEAFKDIVGTGQVTYALGRITQSLYRTTRTPGFIQLSGPATPWMRSPQRMALTAAGDRLFITDSGRNTVVEIDPSDGAFVSDFASLGPAGFSGPTGIAVDEINNAVLVAASNQDAILRFDLTSGQFEGELVAPGSGGLDNPQAMTLVPGWLDRFPTDPDKVIRPNAGLWFNPETNGRGFDIEVFDNVLTAIWFAYDEEGNPLWYFSQGELNGFEYTAPLAVTQLTNDEVIFNDIGTVAISFTDERNAITQWQIGDQSGSESIEWLAFDNDVAAENYTGLWGRPDGPGWGLSLATQGQVTVAVAFIYDSNGNPRWAISDPVSEQGELTVTMNTLFSDSLCPICDGEPAFDRRQSGTMSFGLRENGTWSSQLSFPAPLSGDWILDAVDFIRFSDEPTRPR